MDSSRVRRNKGLAAALSFGAHTVILGTLGFMASQTLLPVSVEPQSILVEIEPRPMVRGEVARKPSTAASPDQTEPAQSFDTPASPARTTTVQQPSELQPNPSSAGSGPTSSAEGASGRSWQVGPDAGLAGRVAQSLRTSVIGCDYPERLSREEQSVCDDKAGERTGRALERVPRITGTGNAQRDARFEAQGRERIRSYERQRSAPPDSERGNIGVEDGPGSNFGVGVAGRHLDPSLRPESAAPIQTRKRDGRPEDRTPRTPPNR